ncbi:TPA: hypothetical protein NII72_003772 [Pseudomonas aeruginosa]|nr:hypothetical protein IPC1233_24455 [Pseudomonas aeruginosa]RUE00477.1 hypothetical protein IPC1234_25650 [Pseudomonas aeruginosa]HBN9627829.1 hypothetical protein [Pseudomonas aeruginosa]HBP5425103.1 hypothetical protein [Pseudomonas aeruginosa]HCF4297519.1 hypothetical protein [Pseudomonas aeruginosa]
MGRTVEDVDMLNHHFRVCSATVYRPPGDGCQSATSQPSAWWMAAKESRSGQLRRVEHVALEGHPAAVLAGRAVEDRAVVGEADGQAEADVGSVLRRVQLAFEVQLEHARLDAFQADGDVRVVHGLAFAAALLGADGEGHGVSVHVLLQLAWGRRRQRGGQTTGRRAGWPVLAAAGAARGLGIIRRRRSPTAHHQPTPEGMMKLPVLAVLGAALLLSACAKKEAEACASPDVKDQLMRIFLQGAITERSPEFKDSALRDVAILEKDPDSGVLSCVGTLSVPAGQQVVEGVLQYRIAPVAKSDYDYLLLDTAGANTTALAQRLNKALGQ